MTFPWKAASITRDTLVHSLGTLAAVMMRYALAEPGVTLRYAGWLARGEPSNSGFQMPYGMRMGVVGFNQGQAIVWARPQADAFVLTAEHPEFRFVVVVGFDVSRDQLFGLFVREFSGSAALALAIAREITSQLTSSTALSLSFSPVRATSASN